MNQFLVAIIHFIGRSTAMVIRPRIGVIVAILPDLDVFISGASDDQLSQSQVVESIQNISSRQCGNFYSTPGARFKRTKLQNELQSYYIITNFLFDRMIRLVLLLLLYEIGRLQ